MIYNASYIIIITKGSRIVCDFTLVREKMQLLHVYNIMPNQPFDIPDHPQ